MDEFSCLRRLLMIAYLW